MASTAPGSDSGTIPSETDFISMYTQYADVLEAPREVHGIVAMNILAALLNYKVSVPFGALVHTLDLWSVILSGSGMGRNTLVGLVYPVIEQSGVGVPVRNNAWGSGPAFYEDFARNPNGLLIWPELGQVLKTLSQSNFVGAKEWLTDRYDNPRKPDDIIYRTGKGKSGTKPIVFEETPRINILATSSLDWFIPNLTQADTTGGFVPRWLLMRVPETTRLISKPQEPDRKLILPLADFLKRAAKLKGGADLSGVEKMYDEWYKAAHKRFQEQPNAALAIPFFNRLRSTILKLAVIFEVSSSCTLKVSSAAMQRAIDQVAFTEQMLFELLPTGLTAEGYASDKVERKIHGAGVPGITRSELTRAYQGDRNSHREDRLRTLLDAGRILAFQRVTKGRPGQVYVHSDFGDQHKKDFPSDTLL